MVKFTKQQQEAMASVKSQLTQWILNGHKTVKIREIQRKVIALAKPHECLKDRTWSAGWISGLKTELGLTRKSLKRIGLEKKMKVWTQDKLRWGVKVQTQHFKDKWSEANRGQKPSRTLVRQMRKELKVKCTASVTKNADTWTKN